MFDEDAELEETVRRNLLSGWGPRPGRETLGETKDAGAFAEVIREFAPRRLSPAEVFSLSLDWSALCEDPREARAWLQAHARLNDVETVRGLKEAGVSPHVAGRWTPTLGDETYFDMVRKGLISAVQLKDLADRKG